MAKRQKTKQSKVLTDANENLSHSPFAKLADVVVAETAKSEAEHAQSITREIPTSHPPLFADKIVVRRETKERAGKTVTRIMGLPTAQLPTLAKEMKRSFGCGAVLDGSDILLLGTLVDRAISWLEAKGAKQVVRGN